jgi:SAM-dependent methyltransferase
MSALQFDTNYAKFYDLLYSEKDYQSEAKFIHSLIERSSLKNRTGNKLLDLACGTGKHLFELYEYGYGLSGSDIASDMIAVAQSNAKEKNKNIKFYNYSFQDSYQIIEKFNVVISMFSAVNYITSYQDQIKTFSNINSLLETNGLFIFDYWNGNAVVKEYSPLKVLRKKSGANEIMRISETTIDQITQEVMVKFTCLYFENNVKLTEFEETHKLHYYFFSEIKNLLLQTGFELIHLCPFMRIDESVEKFDWNISVVARKL